MSPIEHSNGFSQDDLSPVEAERLVMYEEAKANGHGAAIAPAPDDVARKELACVDLMHRVWPNLAPPPLPGEVYPPPRTLGDFRLTRQLGRGGMGTVFEAEQLSMGRYVALKVLPFAALIHEKSLQRFRNEVRASVALNHANIVQVFSIGEERGVHFYAMQLIRGQTVADLIVELRRHREESVVSSPLSVAETTDLPAKDHVRRTTDTQPRAALSTVANSDARKHFHAAARLGIEAAEALQHAHEQGVLHRDIKPSNLLLDREGKLYVTDFGLARIGADAGMTMTGDILGTLRYMAPEQALAKRVVIDHRADIYSLGATLYELLTLRAAFDETDRSELLKQIAFTEPRPLRKIDRNISAELETIVLKAMAKDADERYQSAQLLADDLRAFLDGRPIMAKPPQLLRRIARWTRPKAGLLLAAAVLLLAPIALTWSPEREYPDGVRQLLKVIAQERDDAEAARNTLAFAEAQGRLLQLAADADGMAWTLATSPYDDMRNGELAVELATVSCEITAYQDERKLDTLAAAYAERGDFESAVKWSQKAVGFGPRHVSSREHLYRFRKGRPWREP